MPGRQLVDKCPNSWAFGVAIVALGTNREQLSAPIGMVHFNEQELISADEHRSPTTVVIRPREVELLVGPEFGAIG